MASRQWPVCAACAARTASGPEGMRRTKHRARSILSGPSRVRRGTASKGRPDSPGIASRDVSVLLRKEVIQPQVPLRLPCYDFIPITTHTLDTCPPCGLAQRLWVQTAFMM